MPGAMLNSLDLASRTAVPGSKRRNQWIKRDLSEHVEEGASRVITEKRHVGIVMPDSAGQIEAPLSHVGVRIEARAARRYGKRHG